MTMQVTISIGHMMSHSRKFLGGTAAERKLTTYFYCIIRGIFGRAAGFEPASVGFGGRYVAVDTTPLKGKSI